MEGFLHLRFGGLIYLFVIHLFYLFIYFFLGGGGGVGAYYQNFMVFNTDTEF